jgi:hypothetical protein
VLLELSRVVVLVLLLLAWEVPGVRPVKSLPALKWLAWFGFVPSLPALKWLVWFELASALFSLGV